MTPINEEQIVGNLIPNVYISKITLETSGDTIKEVNPHISYDNKKNTSKKEDSKLLKVKIELIVKDKPSDNMISQWFDNKDLTKYVKISLIQSTDNNLTSFMSLGVDALNYIENKSQNSLVIDEVVKKLFETDNIEDVNSIILNNFSKQTITLNTETKGIIAKKAVYENESGESIYEIKYYIQFLLKDSNPKHLTYFALTAFDLQEMSKDFGFMGEENNSYSKISSDIVIDDYAVFSKNYAFFDDKGNLWTGFVNQDVNGNWFTGDKKTENSKPLTKQETTNTKIQDFRNFKESKKLSVISLANYLSTKKVSEPKLKDYFSPIKIACDMDGNVKYFFSINYENIVIQNISYNSYISYSKRLKEEFIKNTSIKSLKVLRQQVSQKSTNNSLSSNHNSVNPVDLNLPEELIINSEEKDYNNFIKIDNNNGSIEEEFVYFENEKQKIRNFSGTDKKISLNNSGKYCYIVEIEIEDKTKNFVTDKILELLKVKIDLEKYYQIANIPKIIKEEINLQNPHIDYAGEKIATKNNNIGFYDANSNSFTQEFVLKMRELYSDPQTAVWNVAIITYMDTLELFTDFLQNEQKIEEISNFLYSITCPETGNPQGILTTIKMIEDLIKILETIIGDNYSINLIGSEQNTSKKTANSKIIKLRKTFNEVVDRDLNKLSGMDYLSNSFLNEKNIGLRKINFSNFKERANAETYKFFNDENADTSIPEITSTDSAQKTKYTYLTPARIDFPYVSYVFSTEGDHSLISGSNGNKKVEFVLNNSQKYDFLFKIKSDMIAQKISKNVVKSMDQKDITDQDKKSENNLFKSLENMFANETNLTIETVDINEEKNSTSALRLDNNKLSKNINPELFLNQKTKNNLFISFLSSLANNRFYKKHKRNKTLTYKKKPFILNNDFLQSIKTRQQPNKEKIIFGFKNPIKEQHLLMLPNQIKWHLLKESKPSIVSKEPVQKTQEKYNQENIKEIEYFFKTETLKKIEYLAGFEFNDGEENLIKSEEWKLLTDSVINDSLNKKILCRLKQYENQDIGIKTREDLLAPTYDEYFILEIPQEI